MSGRYRTEYTIYMAASVALGLAFPSLARTCAQTVPTQRWRTLAWKERSCGRKGWARGKEKGRLECVGSRGLTQRALGE